MHITLDGFVAGPNGELNWAKVDAKNSRLVKSESR